MDAMYELLGKRIREFRMKSNKTISRLASEADLSDNYLGNIERGVGRPSMVIILSIANALSVGLDDLYRDSLDSARDYSSSAPIRTEINKGLDSLSDKNLAYILHTIEFLKNIDEPDETKIDLTALITNVPDTA